jgi:polar amino acid transport system substrate-binding protein
MHFLLLLENTAMMLILTRKAVFFIMFHSCLYIAHADTLLNITQRGVLFVGVKDDYPPFGYRDSQGHIIGLEPDLAADVAKRLGVKLELVPVTSANRIQYLQDGKIDLMIATLSVTEEREKAVGIIAPHYYASGAGIVVSKKSGFTNASDLKGRSVCAVSGTVLKNQLQSEFTGKEIIFLNSVSDCEAALLRNACDGFAFDEVLLFYKMTAEADKWKDYEVLELSEFDPLPWGLAVRLEDKNTAWGEFVARAITDWLRSDLLLALERKWVGKNTTWLKAVHIKFVGSANNR